MVSEEQLKAEEEQLLNEDTTPPTAEPVEPTPAPAPVAAATPAATPAANNNGKKAENVEETHVTTFDVNEHGAQFHREIVNLRLICKF